MRSEIRVRGLSLRIGRLVISVGIVERPRLLTGNWVRPEQLHSDGYAGGEPNDQNGGVE